MLRTSPVKQQISLYGRALPLKCRRETLLGVSAMAKRLGRKRNHCLSASIEQLELRRLLAQTVSGLAVVDYDANGAIDAPDANHTPIPGGIVFADLDGNLQLNTGEPVARPGNDGVYHLTLDPGSYTLRL